jgi:hypothetical protein
MNDKGSTLVPGKEFKYLSVIFKELLLGVDLTSTQLLLKILLHLCIFLGNPFISLCRSPLVVFVLLSRSLRLPYLLIELSGVVIAVVQIDGPSIENDRLSNSQIISR